MLNCRSTACWHVTRWQRSLLQLQLTSHALPHEHAHACFAYTSRLQSSDHAVHRSLFSRTAKAHVHTAAATQNREAKRLAQPANQRSNSGACLNVSVVPMCLNSGRCTPAMLQSFNVCNWRHVPHVFQLHEMPRRCWSHSQRQNLPIVLRGHATLCPARSRLQQLRLPGLQSRLRVTDSQVIASVQLEKSQSTIVKQIVFEPPTDKKTVEYVKLTVRSTAQG